MSIIHIADRPIERPFEEICAYASNHGRTVREYDLDPGDCGPNQVCNAEVRRTRRIASRISNRQGEEMLRTLAEAAWDGLPRSAVLADADPGARGGLYDAMSAVYVPLLQIPGVGAAKASKLLHLKRPALFPILDSKLMRLYREPASRAARRHPERGARRLYWAAIRDDVLRNRDELEQVRGELRAEEGLVGQMAGLSDVRLLDILAWRI